MPLRIEKYDVGSQLYFSAHNDGPATITAVVAIVSDDMEVDAAMPVTMVLRPHATERVGSARPRGYAQTGRTYTSWNVMWGDMGAVQSAGVRYRLPYENGSAFPITQAFGTRLTTHNGTSQEHAVDFALPEGTPVLAAREGRVVEITLSHWRGGLDPSLSDKANAVQIVHDDGTVATYAHLSQRAAPIKTGERVRAGTLIGYSGDTGYSSGPHLHFAVSRPQLAPHGRLQQVALPVKFYAGVPEVEFAPRRGMDVRAVYAAAVPEQLARPASAAADRADPAPPVEAPRSEPAIAAAAPAPLPTGAAPADRELPAPPRLAVETAPVFVPSPRPTSPAAASAAEVQAAPNLSLFHMGIAFAITAFGVACLFVSRRRG